MSMRYPHTPLLAALLLAALNLPTATAAEGAPPEIEDAAPQASAPRPSDLAKRPDERRRDTGRVYQILGRPVTVNGQWDIAHEWRRNLDLSPEARDRARLDQELKLEALAPLDNGATVFLQLVGQSEWETRRENGPAQSRGTLERGQMWVFVPRPFDLPLDVQIGRIGLIEDRSWWWDEDLDAVRLFFGGTDWLVETGVARRMLPVSTDEHGIDATAEDVVRWFGRGAWQWRKRHTLEAYVLHARDHSDRPAVGTTTRERDVDESDADLTWLGVRAVGEEKTESGYRFGYWADLASVHGREALTRYDEQNPGRRVVTDRSRRDVRGHGWDVGARLSGPGAARPTVWAGWAVGSGDDDPNDDVDHRFRQTGLEENKGRFGGVKRFRYYGELLRPTLSNLDVRSLGVSTRFWQKSSVDLIWHEYRQRAASDTLAASRLSADPTGEDRQLGRAVELFLAFRESPALEWTFSLARFKAGRAFGDSAGERAWFAELGLTLNF